MSHSKDLIHNEQYAKTFFGFWLYLLTDCILFGSLFATYIVLHPNVYGGLSSKQLFDLPHALYETVILLTSSLFAGLGRCEALKERKRRAVLFYGLAFVFGLFFLGMNYLESAEFIARGATWQTSGFLAAFFTVNWTHALHVAAGLFWIAVLLCQIAWMGITPVTFRRLSCFTLFWQFLALIWVFTFTIVYLLGV